MVIKTKQISSSGDSCIWGAFLSVLCNELFHESAFKLAALIDNTFRNTMPK